MLRYYLIEGHVPSTTAKLTQKHTDVQDHAGLRASRQKIKLTNILFPILAAAIVMSIFQPRMPTPYLQCCAELFLATYGLSMRVSHLYTHFMSKWTQTS